MKIHLSFYCSFVHQPLLFYQETYYLYQLYFLLLTLFSCLLNAYEKENYIYIYIYVCIFFSEEVTNSKKKSHPK